MPARPVLLAALLLPALAHAGAPSECLVEAFAGERGIEARAAPDAGAPVIARLPDPILVGDAEVAVAFTVTAHVPGWFRIEEAGFSDEVPHVAGGRRVPLDRGWIPEGAVRTSLAAIALRSAPAEDAPVAARLQGLYRLPGTAFVLFGPEGVGLRRVVGCRGPFVEVETDMGRGWTDRICARQRSPCE
jgi:hypothetical protein